MQVEPGRVVSVHASQAHAFSKATCDSIRLIAGLGVEGDVHAGVTVKHRSRVAADPTQVNLRQVHLLHSELFETLADFGHQVTAGALGENITTAGIDLLALPRGAILRIGDDARVEVTGLRNPCSQIEAFQAGLLGRLVRKRDDGTIERLAGVMSVVLATGDVRAGDPIHVEWPAEPHLPLERV